MLIVNFRGRIKLKSKIQKIFPTNGQIASKYAILRGTKRGQTSIFSWS